MASIARTFGHSAIVHSAADPRQYRGLELTNGLRLLLVSDPDTDKASCAMDVNVGHMKDPPELPGLAHFCEHMLFLGTEKFPVENEYKQYLSQHGGSSNASTSREHTNYFFDVAPDHLPGAIERFAAFFTCPLFTESATEREVNAVDSENSRNIKTDSRRLFQLDKALARPGHDFGKFGTGNKDTLDTLPKASGVDTRSALLAFHQQWYSSNIMGCCVLGREDLDTLQNMLVPELESVENKAVTVPVWDQPPYTQNELQCEVHVVPIKDTRSLSIMWPIPDFHEEYKANPVGYLGHLLGHEGPGSLLSLLKAHGWSNHLSAGAEAGARGFAFFSVSADLTVEGQEHTDEIITMIYQYLAMLRREGPQQWVFYEKKDLAAMSFNFKDKETPRSYTSSIAGRLQQYPMSDILSVYRLYDQWKPQLIYTIMEQLVPQNMKVTVLSKKFEGKTSEIEKWYGTKYSVTRYTPEQLKLWSDCGYNEKLALPPVNEFIPSNFDIVQGDVKPAAFPGILKETPLYRLWYKKDDKFLKPKATVNLDFKSPVLFKKIYISSSLFGYVCF